MQGLEHSDSLKYEFIAITVCYDDNHPKFVSCLENISLYIFMYGGVSKLHLGEMSARYLLIVFYCLLEKMLSRGDYKRPNVVSGNDNNSVRESFWFWCILISK